MTSRPQAPDTTRHTDEALRDDVVHGLRGWYFTHRRRLPWREEPTPYRVWVSEIMLQQTQVATVLPYFERFIAAFPDVASLAAASDEELLSRWSGLGYYRRARNLHAAARLIAHEHGGALPGDVEDLLALPGIGRYTAGAIASIAFGRRAAVLDGNVARVLSRLFAIDTPADSGPGQKRLWALAEWLVPDDASSHNQALMELGALVCTPRSPSCAACPLADRCQARLHGRPEDFPRTAKKTVVKPVHAVAGLVFRTPGNDEILLGRRPDGVLLGGLWELPGAELTSARSARKKALGVALAERTGIAVDVGALIASIQHQFTHRSLSLEIFSVAALAEPPAAPRPTAFYQALAWVSTREVDAPETRTPLSTLTRKVLAAVRHRGTRP